MNKMIHILKRNSLATNTVLAINALLLLAGLWALAFYATATSSY